MPRVSGVFQIKPSRGSLGFLAGGVLDENFSLYLYEAELCNSQYEEFAIVLKGFLRRRFSYDDYGSMPPFTTQQLIAMVLLSHPCDVALHFKDCIVRIIFYSFRFYYGSKDEVETARKQQELIQSVGEELDLDDSPLTGRMVWDEPAAHPRTLIGIQHDLKDQTLHGTVSEKEMRLSRLATRAAAPHLRFQPQL